MDVQSWTDQRKWMRLEILNTTKTTVEFKAHYLESLEPRIQHEKSTFKASHGKWYYLDGIFLS
ncbi:UPF0225 protein YchJ [Sphingobacterium sp. JB170]|nr:UPF0225 protein YchJ [Sphingobacterium sp. JB170]